MNSDGYYPQEPRRLGRPADANETQNFESSRSLVGARENSIAGAASTHENVAKMAYTETVPAGEVLPPPTAAPLSSINMIMLLLAFVTLVVSIGTSLYGSSAVVNSRLAKLQYRQSELQGAMTDVRMELQAVRDAMRTLEKTIAVKQSDMERKLEALEKEGKLLYGSHTSPPSEGPRNFQEGDDDKNKLKPQNTPLSTPLSPPAPAIALPPANQVHDDTTYNNYHIPLSVIISITTFFILARNRNINMLGYAICLSWLVVVLIKIVDVWGRGGDQT